MYFVGASIPIIMQVATFDLTPQYSKLSSTRAKVKSCLKTLVLIAYCLNLMSPFPLI